MMLKKKGSLGWSFNLEIALKTGRYVPEDSPCQINRLGSAALSRQCYSFILKLVRGRQVGQVLGKCFTTKDIVKAGEQFKQLYILH